MFIEENLYAEIFESIPIPYVDIIVVDQAGRILLPTHSSSLENMAFKL
jgi:hypothetical protein